MTANHNELEVLMLKHRVDNSLQNTVPSERHHSIPAELWREEGSLLGPEWTFARTLRDAGRTVMNA